MGLLEVIDDFDHLTCRIYGLFSEFFLYFGGIFQHGLRDGQVFLHLIHHGVNEPILRPYFNFNSLPISLPLLRPLQLPFIHITRPNHNIPTISPIPITICHRVHLNRISTNIMKLLILFINTHVKNHIVIVIASIGIFITLDWFH